MRIARWSARLMCFQYDIEYRPGTQNVLADCLSRVPLETTSLTEPEPDLFVEIAEISPLFSALPLADFKAESEDCPELKLLREVSRSKWPKTKKSLPTELQPYFLMRHELAVDSPLVFRGTRLVVPKSLRERIVHVAHEGHQGIVRTKQRLRELYWWPNMDSLVYNVLSSCTVCQKCDKTAKATPAPLQPVEFPEGPFQHVAVDIVGPFERGPQDCRFAITLVDYFSKWPEVAFTSNATTATVLTFLSAVFSREGNPCAITTDNGPQFTSCDFADFLKERGIKHIKTSVYHPQANGCVERFNRVLKDCIQGAQAVQKPWKPTVTAMLQSYRATPHATTNESPFKLLRGRQMRTKLHILPQSDRTGQYDAPSGLEPALLERLVLGHLRSTVSSALDPLQFAYRPGIGVEDAVIFLLHRSLSHLEKPGCAVRILFFDFSSAFNTIQPLLLRDKLETAGVDCDLAEWILDYLTNRPQFKFSDDSAIIGLITDDDDAEYRGLTHFVDWCQQNHLLLNAGKTKEMVVDFRRRHSIAPPPVNIQGRDIERVDSYKYLGVHLNNKLDWTHNTDALYRKGQSRLYLLRRLRSFGVRGPLLRTFYDSVVASAILYGVVCWSSSITERERKKLDKVIKKSSSVLGCPLDSVREVGDRRVLARFTSMLDHESHPLQDALSALESSFSDRLIHPRCVKERFRRSFLPAAVRLYNEHC
ncbi:hypothetical protein WMY93_027577 [Mugilogobius chulae]|uniref:Gypsy retrotransposon integrase-like protein 1 n=1 Tax=Mugilogobius chulae TaxID=88201 RepID=A0AAW0MTC7_9GOBI